MRNIYRIQQVGSIYGVNQDGNWIYHTDYYQRRKDNNLLDIDHQYLVILLL